MGNPTPKPTDLAGMLRDIHNFINRRIDELATFDGSQYTRAVEKLTALVEALPGEIDAALAVEVNTGEVSATGNVTAGGNLSGVHVTATGNVTSSGQVVSALPFKSPGSRAYTVVTGYVAAWINTDGTIGYSPSTKRVKKDLVPFVGAENLLALNVYRGRYVWDAEDAPLQSFLLAEEVADAGFSDMVPTDAEGIPETVNYSQLTIPIIEVLKQQDARLTDIEARLTAAGL